MCKIAPISSQPKMTKWCFRRVWLLEVMLGDEVWAPAGKALAHKQPR